MQSRHHEDDVLDRNIPAEIEWLEPWQPLEGCGDALVAELQRELAPDHVLHGVDVAPLARRIDCDEVLFATADPQHPLAVVHLTWTTKMERDPRWPWTTLFSGWADWIERCLLPDHREYASEGKPRLLPPLPRLNRSKHPQQHQVVNRLDPSPQEER